MRGQASIFNFSPNLLISEVIKLHSKNSNENITYITKTQHMFL